jgi:saccharopine dehydrogenase (NAD+, L-lysine-forming)
VVDFPAPIGPQTLYFQQHSEPITFPRHFPGLRNVKVYGTYHPAIMDALRVFRDHGLLDPEPTEIGGRQVSPRALLTQMIGTREIPFPGPTHYTLIITVTGKRDGANVTHTYTMTHDPEGPRKGQLPQIWMTAVGVAVGAQLMCTPAARGTGVMAPEGCLDPDAILKGAVKGGYEITWETHVTRSV